MPRKQTARRTYAARFLTGPLKSAHGDLQAAGPSRPSWRGIATTLSPNDSGL